MAAASLDTQIEVTTGIASGKPRITGQSDHGSRHRHLARAARPIGGRDSAEYGLTLADVYPALAYYFDHRAEIDLSIAEGEAFAKDLRARTPSKLAARVNQQTPGTSD
jgi:uncharacterized protein (DUF433 family)